MTPYFIKPKITVAPITVESLEEFNIGEDVLILVSKTILNNFNLSVVFDELGMNRNLYIYSHIRPDAPFDDLDKVIEQLKAKKLNTIIAIGGGSIIDAAKTLSISFNGVSYKDIFYKIEDMPNRKIPVLAIPTTAGTGAELSFGAIIYDNENKVKGGVRGEIVQPNGVLIDANLHNACPFKLKAEVGFDSLTHAVETYISKKSNPLVRNQSVSCIENVFKYLIPACKNNDFHAMEKIAISSALMGINLAYSSTCLPHRMQYVIGPMTQTSHAQGLIALYKGWMAHLVEIDLKEFNDLANDLGMTNLELVDKIGFLKKELNIEYSITDLGINQNQIRQVAEKVTGDVSADPSYINLETIINILKYSI
jgi:alcohol dehydrogenase class IV